MVMALTQAPRTGALARSHGRWCGTSFYKEILKALLYSAGAGYGGLEKRRACPLAALLTGCVLAMQCGAMDMEPQAGCVLL